MSLTENERENTLAEVWTNLNELKEDAARGASLSFEGAEYQSGLADAADSVFDMMSENTRKQLPRSPSQR